MELSPLQKKILREALRLRQGTFEFVYRTVLLSFPKKSGKTGLAAAITLWYAWSQGANNEVYVLANDEQQAKERVFADIVYGVRHMPWLKAVVRQDRVKLEGNGTEIIALGMHHTSAAGSRHGLTVWDELWGFETELHHRLWDEMTPVPTEPASLRLIVTYAGYEPGNAGRGTEQKNLLWELYSQNVGPEEWRDGLGAPVEGFEGLPIWSRNRVFTCWFHQATMPWQTDEYYNDERDELRPSAFLRLHKNQWVTSTEGFIELAWWDQACVLPGPLPATRSIAVQVAIDFAPKHDSATAVGTYFDWKTKKVRLAFHRIWVPQGEGLDPGVVENYLMSQFVLYRITWMGYDPYQFHGSAVRLKNMGLPMVEVPQTDPNMIPATEELYGVLKYHRFEAYPDDEARSHIAATTTENKGRGVRLSKAKSTNKIDFTVALAMSVLETVRSGSKNLSEEVVIESPFSDLRGWPVDYDAWKAEQALPFELRQNDGS